MPENAPAFIRHPAVSSAAEDTPSVKEVLRTRSAGFPIKNVGNDSRETARMTDRAWSIYDRFHGCDRARDFIDSGIKTLYAAR